MIIRPPLPAPSLRGTGRAATGDKVPTAADADAKPRLATKSRAIAHQECIEPGPVAWVIPGSNYSQSQACRWILLESVGTRRTEPKTPRDRDPALTDCDRDPALPEFRLHGHVIIVTVTGKLALQAGN